MSKKKTQASTPKNNYVLIPLLLVIFLVPLIMRAYIFDSGFSAFTWFPDQTDELDLFLYWKSIWLIIFAAVMSVILFVKLRKNLNEIKKEYWIYFLIGYGSLALISTLASPYRVFGFTGSYKQFESIWVILSYCIITLFAFCFIRSDNDLKLIRKTLYCLLAVLCFIGLLQMMDMDLFESDFGRALLIPKQFDDIISELNFNFSGSGTHQVYMTLLNPNYVGMFATLIFPVSVVLIFTARTKVNKIAWITISIVLLICTFGSGSKTFMLSLIAILIIALIFYRKLVFQYWKAFIAVVAVFFICGTAYFSYRNIDLFQYIKSAIMVEKSTHPLEAVNTSAEGISITYRGETLNIQYQESSMGIYYIFTDESGHLLEHTITEQGLAAFTDERFQNIQFAVHAGTDEYLYRISAVIDGVSLSFAKTENGYQYVNAFNKIDEIVPIESAIFTDYDHFATERGYIWSRTIPLLKKYFFLGSGADTFTIVFPQNDYIGKFNVGFYDMVVTRPHNLYLQIAVQHGCLALFCFLTVCLIYFVQCCKIYWNTDLSKSRNIFGIGIMLGIIGYLISGMTTDSCVAVAPLFWALLGIGFAVNRMNKTELNTI